MVVHIFVIPCICANKHRDTDVAFSLSRISIKSLRKDFPVLCYLFNRRPPTFSLCPERKFTREENFFLPEKIISNRKERNFAREGEQFRKFTRKERKKEEKPAKTRKGEFWSLPTLWCDPLCRNARLNIWI